MERLAIYVAAVLHLLGCSVFFGQPMDYCSPAPSLASWIFLLATLCFLSDVNIYPCRFMHMSRAWQLVIETVAAIFLVELGTIILWCGIERCLFSLLDELLFNIGFKRCLPASVGSWLSDFTNRSCCKPQGQLYWLSGLVTSSASFAILWYVLEATESFSDLKKIIRNLKRNIRLTWQMMCCYFAMNMSSRRRTLKVCQMAVNRCRPNKPRRGCRKQQEDDDDSCDESE